MLGIGGAGVAIGASGVGSVWSFKSMFNTPEDPERMHNFMVKCNRALPHPHKNMQFRCVRFEVKR